MLKSLFLWILAILITLGSAVYQRKTGPTYPIEGEIQFQGSTIMYSLERSHGGEGDQLVSVATKDTAVTGKLLFKRYPTDDPWTEIDMTRKGEQLQAFLPHQPPAGKLEYHLVLYKNDGKVMIPSRKNVVIRFKGDVPPFILLPHILLMFLAMLFSTRTGLEALRREPKLKSLVFWTVGLLFVGGMILGPWVQWHAFGAFWTGIPYGTDLTDNKTLIAMIVWIIALGFTLGKRNARVVVLIASVVLLLIFIIPHSMHGSELDYSQIETGHLNI